MAVAFCDLVDPLHFIDFQWKYSLQNEHGPALSNMTFQACEWYTVYPISIQHVHVGLISDSDTTS